MITGSGHRRPRASTTAWVLTARRLPAPRAPAPPLRQGGAERLDVGLVRVERQGDPQVAVGEHTHGGEHVAGLERARGARRPARHGEARRSSSCTRASPSTNRLENVTTWGSRSSGSPTTSVSRPGPLPCAAGRRARAAARPRRAAALGVEQPGGGGQDPGHVDSPGTRPCSFSSAGQSARHRVPCGPRAADPRPGPRARVRHQHVAHGGRGRARAPHGVHEQRHAGVRQAPRRPAAGGADLAVGGLKAAAATRCRPPRAPRPRGPRARGGRPRPRGAPALRPCHCAVCSRAECSTALSTTRGRPGGGRAAARRPSRRATVPDGANDTSSGRPPSTPATARGPRRAAPGRGALCVQAPWVGPALIDRTEQRVAGSGRQRGSGRVELDDAPGRLVARVTRTTSARRQR